MSLKPAINAPFHHKLLWQITVDRALQGVLDLQELPILIRLHLLKASASPGQIVSIHRQAMANLSSKVVDMRKIGSERFLLETYT